MTVLALNSERFRGDLEILAASGDLRVLRIPFAWQAKFLSIFFSAEQLRYGTSSGYWHSTDPVIRKGQQEIRRFLRRFLARLYERLGVDAVISAALHYVQDYDWGVVSREIGRPYVVLHRENLHVSASAWKEAFVARCESMAPFPVDAIIVHNDPMGRILRDSGMIEPERVHVLGCVRMDRFVEQIDTESMDAPDLLRSSPPEVVLFSFSPQIGMPGVSHFSESPAARGFHELFDQVHLVIAELAQERPDVRFTIKTKWAGRWADTIGALLAKAGFRPDEMQNLTITAGADVHDLIRKASVVVAFGSTTLLEAGAAGVPVIVPMFAEAVQPEYRPFIYFLDEIDAFDVAGSRAALKDLVLRRIADSSVDSGSLDHRRRVFERWVTPLSGRAAGRYIAVIREVVAEAARRAPARSNGLRS